MKQQRNLRNYYSPEDNDWSIVDGLYKEVKKELENQRPSPRSEKKLFEALIEIDFKEQENDVKKAIESQKNRCRTVAFLVHGDDDKYGQAMFIERLFRNLPELQNGRKIKRKFNGEVSDLWKETAQEFFGSSNLPETLEEKQKQTLEKISLCLQSQNLIFILYVPHIYVPREEPISDIILDFKVCSMN